MTGLAKTFRFGHHVDRSVTKVVLDTHGPDFDGYHFVEQKAMR